VFIQIGAMKLATDQWGDPEAPPLLLLHGITSSARVWDDIAARWSGEFRIIAYDQRGHGESDHVLPGGFESYNVTLLASDIDAVVTALGLERFSVLGHSLGGRPVIAYAKIRPEIIDHAVIVDIGPEMDRSGGRAVRDNVKAQTSDGPEVAVAEAPPIQYDPTLVELTGRKSLAEVDYLWECMRELSCPTLIVRGEISNILSQDIAERMAVEAPQAQLAVIPNAGHDVPRDNPDAFESRVLAFLRS
jgi:pimeloyl-ACP methyl ester carboxylesterase